MKEISKIHYIVERAKCTMNLDNYYTKEILNWKANQDMVHYFIKIIKFSISGNFYRINHLVMGKCTMNQET